MYSDEWFKQGCKKGKKINVTSVVNYVIWMDKNGAAVGVTINFDTANDFHYELQITEWNKFVIEVLHDENTINTERILREFINNNNSDFAFEEVLDARAIEYKKIAFY